MTIMAFRGTEQIRNKIYINDRILKHINTYDSLGYNRAYEREKNLNIIKWENCNSTNNNIYRALQKKLENNMLMGFKKLS
jgi:hypothetical protein